MTGDKSHGHAVTCACCGSEDVYRSRISYWSKDQGAWIDEPFSDDYYCNECGGSCELVVCPSGEAA